MKLLIVAQTVDERDLVLGFFCRWIAELAPHFESIDVIALGKGTCTLPENVRVHSLGKERGPRSAFTYAWRFLLLAWRLRTRYDRVFVHMNEEYPLLGGLMWKLLHKPLYFWRNHYAGSWKTSLACALSTTVFYTSQDSFTARFKNAVRMPIGVDLDRFSQHATSKRNKNSLLFLARMSPSKRPDVLIQALGILNKKGVPFSATLCGSPSREDEDYYRDLHEQVSDLRLREHITFVAGVPHAETHTQYEQHEFFVNVSRSGMFDKTLFEAASSGCLVVSANRDLAEVIPQLGFSGEADDLAKRLEALFELPSEVRSELEKKLRALAVANSLGNLSEALSSAILRTPV